MISGRINSEIKCKFLLVILYGGIFICLSEFHVRYSLNMGRYGRPGMWKDYFCTFVYMTTQWNRSSNRVLCFVSVHGHSIS